MVEEADGTGEDDRLRVWLFDLLLGAVVHWVEAARGVLDDGGITEALRGLRRREASYCLLPHEVNVTNDAGNAEVVSTGQRAALSVLGVPLSAAEAKLVSYFSLSRL